MFERTLAKAAIHEKNQKGVRGKIVSFGCNVFDRFASDVSKEMLKRAAWYELDAEMYFTALTEAFEESDRIKASKLIDANHVRHHGDIFRELVKCLSVDKAQILLEFERLVENGRSLHFLLEEKRLFPKKVEKVESSSCSTPASTPLEEVEKALKKARSGRKPSDPQKVQKKNEKIALLEQQRELLLKSTTHPSLEEEEMIDEDELEKVLKEKIGSA